MGDNEEDSDEKKGLLSDFFKQTMAGTSISMAQYLATAKTNSIKGGESDKSFERNLEIQNLTFASNIPVSDVMKVFHTMENEFITYNFYCLTCQRKVCSSSAENMSLVRGQTFDCGNPDCDLVKVDLTGNKCDVEAMLDVKAQLKGIFQLPQIDQMVEPLDKVHNRSSVKKDIYDGDRFKEIVRTRDLDREDLILLHSTDGLQPYAGCRSSIWTHLWAIANLDPRFRFQPQCMVLSSVMFCKNGSPPAQFFEGSFEATLTNISEIAIPWNYQGEDVVSNVTVGFSCNDLPASKKQFKSPAHNSYEGCRHCRILGRYIQKGRGGSVYFPCDHDANLNLKTDQEVRQWGAEAQVLNDDAGSEGLSVHGYTGVSEFSKVAGFDLVKDHVIDVMHGVYEGLMKALLMDWISGVLKDFLALIQERLDQLHLTSESSRTSFNIYDVAHWKASQFRNFAVFGLVILADILPNPYFEHFCKLSSACHILESDHITEEMLDLAETLLLEFYRENPYGDNAVTMNYHATGYHVADSVRMWGPFFVTSNFCYESAMHTIKNLVSGSAGASSQIARGWMLTNRLKQIADTVKADNVVANHIYDIAVGIKKLVNPLITEYGVVMSSHEQQTKRRCLSDAEHNNLLTNCNKQINKHCEVIVSSKVRADGHVLTSTSYKEGDMKQKMDSLVVVRKNGRSFVAVVKCFVTVDLSEETYCILSEFEHKDSTDPIDIAIRNSCATHCWPMQLSGIASSCRLMDIVGKCMSITKAPSTYYVIKLPTLKAFE